MMLYPNHGTLFLNNFSFESLQDQIFNPFEINESTSVLTDNAYPDIHLFNDPLQGIFFKRIQIITLRIILMSYIAN